MTSTLIKWCFWLRRLQRISCGQIFALVGILLLWWVVSRYPERFTLRQRQDIFYKDDLKQSDLDYFAENIQLNYSVLENRYNHESSYRAKIVFTNKGNRVFPWKKWSIIFCQTFIPDPQHRPYGSVKKESGIRLFHLQGGVLRLEPVPAESFEGIGPGEEKSIEFITRNYNIGNTYNFPNWYFTVEGLQPRIIESTRGESFDWLGKYDTPNLWKRSDDPDAVDYDYYNPLTLDERFDQQSVHDLKGAPFPVLPVPADLELYDPSSKVNVQSGNWVIVAPTLLANEANYLGDALGLRVVFQRPAQEYIEFIVEEVKLSSDGKDLPTEESYGLIVSPDARVITIKASKPAGAFYGIQTLKSLSDAKGNIPKVKIRDAPRYEYRGLMLDVARNFQAKEKIFRYIELMAMYKLNKLHLHLTDDEGWRLAIPGLPELTEIGATRCHDSSETKCLLPFLGSGPFPGPPGSGFYSVEDYRAILRHAAIHHIEVIPEIDLPGHNHAAIKAMDARRNRLMEFGFNMTESSRFLLRDLQDNSKYSSVQNFNDNVVNPCLQSTYTFISRVVNTLFAMHKDVNPLKIFHFGGDEVPKSAWTKSPACQNFLGSGVDISLSDYLAIQISSMTSSYNLDLAGWEDGLFSNLKKHPIEKRALKNKNVYAYAWNNVWEWGSAGRAYDFANNGYKVVLTPATNFYLDHPYESDPTERGMVWANRFIDTFTVYRFFPENMFWNAEKTVYGGPIDLCSGSGCPKLKKKENIAGLQGSLFGELLRTQEITDHMLLPRLIALAERAWHRTTWESEPDKAKRTQGLKEDWTKFVNTLGYKELARLDKLGYKYRIPLPGAKLDGDKLHVSIEFPGLVVELSRDGGKTWEGIDSSNIVTIHNRDSCMLRSRSASGFRHSKALTVSGCGVLGGTNSGSTNSDISRTVLLLSMLTMFAFNYSFTFRHCLMFV